MPEIKTGPKEEPRPGINIRGIGREVFYPTQNDNTQHLGNVTVIDTMGDDAAIVQAARISYGKGTKTLREDRGLIRYLMRNGHTSPFEMAEIKLRIRCPMDVWRQWIRHRTANVNEYSTRYSEAVDETLTTPPDAWRLQAKGNRQGSLGLVINDTSEYKQPHAKNLAELLTIHEKEIQEHARRTYNFRISHGVAREQARKDLPLSTFTEAYWKIDVHNLLHFLKLRLDTHAQLEIRLFAQAIADLVQMWMPLTWEAFEDYILNAVTLSQPQLNLLRRFLNTEINDADANVLRYIIADTNLPREEEKNLLNALFPEPAEPIEE